MEDYAILIVVGVLCYAFVFIPVIIISTKIISHQLQMQSLIKKRVLMPCISDTDWLVEEVNSFYSPDDAGDRMAVREPYRFGKMCIYRKVRQGRGSITVWGEILFPFQRSGTDSFIIVFAPYGLLERHRIENAQFDPEDLCGSLNVELEIPPEWGRRNVRAVFGGEGTRLAGELQPARIEKLLAARRSGAFAFMMMDDYAMISFDPSSYDLNLGRLWECASELSG